MSNVTKCYILRNIFSLQDIVQLAEHTLYIYETEMIFNNFIEYMIFVEHTSQKKSSMETDFCGGFRNLITAIHFLPI